MNYTPYKFTAEVWASEKYPDNSGQLVESWEYSRTIKCSYMPSRGEERLVGRVQNPHSYTLWSDEAVDYSEEVRDLKDRYGNFIEEGRFNVIGVKRFPGWAAVHHNEINIQKVLD